MSNKTQTLSVDGDEPDIVICVGHVDAKTFNQAFKNEGWSDLGDWADEDLTHGYGRWEEDTFYSQERRDSEYDTPYTYVAWDN